MFAVCFLGLIILLIIHLAQPAHRVRRQRNIPSNRGKEKYTYDISYPVPKFASIEDYEKFLQKEHRYIPLWWKTVKKEGVQFTPEQTKLVEDFLAAGKYLDYPDPKTATVREFMDFLYDHTNERYLSEWWDTVQKAKIKFSQWQINMIKSHLEVTKHRCEQKEDVKPISVYSDLNSNQEADDIGAYLEFITNHYYITPEEWETNKDD